MGDKHSYISTSPARNHLFSLLSVILVLLLAACEKEYTLPENGKEDSDVQDTISANEFVVTSFNLRNEVESDPQSLDERKWNILKVIIENSPDVLGVQEIAADWMSDWLSNQLNAEGYDKYLSSGQFGSPKIIYFKRTRFSLKAQGTFQMQFTDKRAGTWVILQENETKNRYFFCNSHWTTVSSEERVSTANIILDVVKKNYQGLPVIILGDFNAEPGAPEITTIKKGNGFNLFCAHGEKGDTFHRWKGTGEKKIDWILCSENLTVKNAGVITTSYDGFYPSDHWPVKATVKRINQ